MKNAPPPYDKGAFTGAVGRIRTGDLRITSALLYQLSHNSIVGSRNPQTETRVNSALMIISEGFSKSLRQYITFFPIRQALIPENIIIPDERTKSSCRILTFPVWLV
jgi:hypothetical protein